MKKLIIDAVPETAKGLHKIGLVDSQTLQESNPLHIQIIKASRFGKNSKVDGRCEFGTTIKLHMLFGKQLLKISQKNLYFQIKWMMDFLSINLTLLTRD